MFLSPPLSYSVDEESTFAEHLKQLSTLPKDVLEFKQNAWECYRNLAFPGPKAEHWRFSKVQAIKDFGLHDLGHSISSPSDILERKLTVKVGPSDLILLNNSCFQEPLIAEELKAQGLIFCSLTKALHSYPDLILSYLGKAGTSLGGDKYLALSLAYCYNGYFLYVPPGIRVAEPFVIYHVLRGKQISSFPISITLGEAQSSFHVREVYVSDNDDSTSLTCAYSLVKGMQESHITKTILQNLSPRSVFYHIDRNFLAEKAAFKGFNIQIGSQYTRNESHLKLVGEHCKGELYGLGLGRGKQEIDTRTLQVHGAAHSYSNLLYKNVLLEESRSIFSGLIKVEPEAQGVDAYQKNRNLLLSDEAEANALPGLEILANEVKCSHGATSSELDAEQLYYLMSRGISKQQAQALLIFSFLEELLEKNEDAESNAIIRYCLEEKLKALDDNGI
jgi:Fe-S cluster assembly protein SufD